MPLHIHWTLVFDQFTFNVLATLCPPCGEYAVPLLAVHYLFTILMFFNAGVVPFVCCICMPPNRYFCSYDVPQLFSCYCICACELPYFAYYVCYLFLHMPLFVWMCLLFHPSVFIF